MRIAITGRPEGAFVYDLQLVVRGGKQDGDVVIPGPQGLTFYAPVSTAGYLDSITLDADRLTGALRVDNPNPLWQQPLPQQVLQFLDEQINPISKLGAVNNGLGPQAGYGLSLDADLTGGRYRRPCGHALLFGYRGCARRQGRRYLRHHGRLRRRKRSIGYRGG